LSILGLSPHLFDIGKQYLCKAESYLLMVYKFKALAALPTNKNGRSFASYLEKKVCSYKPNFHLSIVYCGSLRQALISQKQFQAD
jgi:hypothetical protein